MAVTPVQGKVTESITLVKEETKQVQTNISLSKEDIKNYICTKGWDCALAIKIFTCESGLNPSSINNNPNTGDYSVGISQINLIGNLRKSRPPEEWLLNPKNNIDYAFEMYQKQGFKPWSCAKMV